MYQIIFDNATSIQLEINFSENKISGKIQNQSFTADVQQIHPYEYYIQYKHRTYHILILKINNEEKKLTFKVNGKRVNVQVKDRFDILLHELGMDKISQKKVSSIKAPMPGMVLNILVSEGQAVKKGDNILILEAMKMENILKAPADGVVKKIAVTKGTAVEKNQLLIEF